MEVSTKNLFLLGMLGAGLMMGISSCSDDDKNASTYKVTFNFQTDGKKDSVINVQSGSRVTKPTDPTKEGSVFIDWYSVAIDTTGKKFDFNSEITKETTLYAFWKSNQSNHRKQVEATGRTETWAVQLWKDGPYWAELNVGATIDDYDAVSNWDAICSSIISYQTSVDETDEVQKMLFACVGNYYNWGTTEQHNSTNKDVYKQETESLSGNDDVATVKWGEKWRMPTANGTDGELDVLLKLATWQNYNAGCTTIVYKSDYNFKGSSIKGVCFKGEGEYAGDSIFFPATGFCFNGKFSNVGKAGYCWSSDYAPDDANGNKCAYYLNLNTTTASVHSGPRSNGRTVRAVTE